MKHHKILIGVMAIAIIILACLWIRARNDLDNVLARLGDDSEASKQLIKEKCNPLTLNDAGKKAECQKALNDYSKTVKAYQTEVAGANKN